MRKAIGKILFPGKITGFLAFNIGFALLIYVFVKNLERTPLAYISYALSTYALVIFCAWLGRVCRLGSEAVKRSGMYRLYQDNFFTVTRIAMYSSFAFNLIYGIFKLCLGIRYTSWWFVTFAVYYLILCFMRLSLVRNINNDAQAYRKLRHTGMILLLLNLVLVGIIVLIIRTNQVIRYDGDLIYFVALADFFLIIRAVVNVFKYRKDRNPVIAAGKCVNLTVAMISMVSLEVAMVYQFGNNDSDFRLKMTASMGFAICVINSAMAVYMIVRAKGKMRSGNS